MVAPRGLLIIENTSQVWLGDQSCWGNSVAGNYIYQALGIGDSQGVSQVGNHNHCAFPASQEPELTAYLNRYLFDKTANTAILKTDGNFKFDSGKWVDWSYATLQ